MGKLVRKTSEVSNQKTTGKTFWDVLEILFTGKPLIVLLTILGILIVTIVLILTGLLHAEIKDGKFSMSFNKISSSPVDAQKFSDSITTFCINKGLELKKNYVLRSVVQSYHFDLINQTKDTLVVRERIIYDLIALTDISKSQNIFKEEYSSNVAFKVNRWYGNQEEKILHMGNESAYYLHFDCKKGESITLITGADFYYKFPLPNERLSEFRDYRLKSNEDIWIYPNDEDVIGKLTMILSSENIKFIPITDGALHTINGNTNDDNNYFYNQDENMIHTNNSISATWTKILPDEQFALKVKW